MNLEIAFSQKSLTWDSKLRLLSTAIPRNFLFCYLLFLILEYLYYDGVALKSNLDLKF